MLKTAEFAPIPSAKMNTTAAANNRVLAEPANCPPKILMHTNELVYAIRMAIW